LLYHGWELLFADDLIVIDETEDDLIKRLNEWKDNMENRVVRVSMNKMKVMISGECLKLMQKAARWSVVEVLVIIQYSELVVRSGYTRSVVV